MAKRLGYQGATSLIFKDVILEGYWARLTPGEKSLYPVLGLKARINNPVALDLGYHAIGFVDSINKYIKFAGISRWTFYRAYFNLYKRDLSIFSKGIITDMGCIQILQNRLWITSKLEKAM